MHRLLASFEVRSVAFGLVAAACALAPTACVSSVEVGQQGGGGSGSQTAAHAGTGGAGGAQAAVGAGGQSVAETGTVGAGMGTGGAVSVAATTTGAGTGGGSVSQDGGPCGGNVFAPPPECAQGLHCVQDNPDVVGTCAKDGQTVSGEGGPCGGFRVNPPICAWNLTCQDGPNPDAGGTCVASTSTGAGGGSGSGGDSGGCGWITVEGDGATRAYDFACKGSYGASYTNAAFGYIGYARPISVDPSQKEQVWLEGCATANQDPLAGSIALYAEQAEVGTVTSGQATYDSGTDTYSTDTDVTLTIAHIDGTSIEGAYTALVAPANNCQSCAKQISGTFSVCRVADFLPP